MKSRFLKLAAICLLLGSIGAANAVPITGAIGFGGSFTPSGGIGDDLSDATGIDIGFSVVVATAGDFDPALGFNASFNHLDFNPANTPVTPLWTVDTGPIVFSFDLLGISVDLQSPSELELSGTGMLMATGFDDTPGTWTFSAMEGNVFFTFASIGEVLDPVPIPEPGTIALLGIGLFGMGIARRRKKA